MVIKHKKGIGRIALSITSIMMMLVIGIFMFIFLDQSVGQFLIEPLNSISVGIANEGQLGTGYNETLLTLKTSYDNRLIPYDFYFIFLFIIAFITTNFAAIQAKKQGTFSFFGYIFMLSMIFLFIMFFVTQFTDYFIENIFTPLFNDTTLDIPLITWFFRNISLIAFGWFMWLGLINQIDLKKNIKSGLSRVTEGGFRR